MSERFLARATKPTRTSTECYVEGWSSTGRTAIAKPSFPTMLVAETPRPWPLNARTARERRRRMAAVPRTGRTHPVPRAKTGGRGGDVPSGVFFSFWRTGCCSTQGCKWEHRANPNKGKGGKGGSRNPSTDSKGPQKAPRLHQRTLQVPRSRELQARGPVPVTP